MGTYVPLDAHSDGLNRSWRTFLQGFLIDLAVTLSAALAMAFGTIAWTPEYWLGIAALVGKTAVQTAMAYIHRRVFPPLG